MLHPFVARLARVSALLPTALLLALAACSGASWQKVEIESAYQAPKSLKIAIVARPGMKSAADALGASLVSELDGRGIQASVVSEADGSPDVTVSIVKWDPGSRSTRWLTSTIAGRGQALVTVESLGVEGTAQGWVSGGFFGGADENSVEAAGSLIAKTIATGKRDTAPSAAQSTPRGY